MTDHLLQPVTLSLALLVHAYFYEKHIASSKTSRVEIRTCLLEWGLELV